MTLEKILRDLVARGELTHLSVVPVAGKGPGGIVYCASLAPATKWGHVYGTDADPVEAILKAYAALKLPKPREQREPTPTPRYDHAMADDHEIDVLDNPGDLLS
jgi:hypothetical protein